MLLVNEKGRLQARIYECMQCTINIVLQNENQLGKEGRNVFNNVCV